MRPLIAVGCALLIAVAPSIAGAAPSRFVVKGDTVEQVSVAEWQAGGKMHKAVGADMAAKAPKGSSHYSLKAVTWPTGTVRVLTFTKAGGGVKHAITDETEFLVLKGSVTIVWEGKPTTLHENDAVSLPSGVVTGAGDATLVTWTVGSLITNPTPKIVRAEEASVSQNASVTTPQKIYRYEFPGNSIRRSVPEKGGTTKKASFPMDSLMYLTNGHLRMHEGNEVIDLVAGDFFREVAGEEHFFDLLETSQFVTTTGVPKDFKPAPAEAKDSMKKK